MSVTIYHNPKCSKSRQTLELLIKQGIKPVLNEYLKNPPTAEEIKEILRKLGYPAKSNIFKNKLKFRKLLIKAFQRRFRPELINGKIDQECLLIINKLRSIKV